jgi:hypothetical protein
VALNYTTITETFKDGSGSPLSNVIVTFTPSEAVYSAGNVLASPASPIVATVNTGGQLKAADGSSALTLLATDNSGLTYEGLTGFFYWTVTINVSGTTQIFSFFLPSSPTTVELYALANTAAGGSSGFTNPMTTLGDLIYEDATPAANRLAGSTSASKRFLTQTGTGSASAAPAWGAIAAGDLPTGTTGAQGALQLDGTAADIQPVGVQAAGAKGQAADAEHVHPYHPWQFHVKAYGAKGDGQIVTDGAITTSTAALACATSTPFANAVAGMPIHVGGAGGGTYTPLCTTIASKTDSGHVTLTASATSTVTSGIVCFGTDDTAAIKNAVNAAVAYAQANHGYAEVLFDPVIYIVGGAPVIGGATAGNAQIPLPVIAGTAEKVTLVFRGTRNQESLSHWLQTTPQASGAVLAGVRNDGTVDATNGPATVIGGPYNGYGGGTTVFSNMHAVIDGLSVVVPYNGTYGGFDFYGVGEASVPSASCIALAVPPTGSSVPSMSNPGSHFSSFGFYGLRMPSTNNNAVSVVGNFMVEGMAIGFGPSEHCNWNYVEANYCYTSLLVYGANSGAGMAHWVKGKHTVIGECVYGVYFYDGANEGPYEKVVLDTISVESVGNFAIYDPSNYGLGFIGFARFDGSPIASGGSHLRIIDRGKLPGHMASPPSVPASTSAAALVYGDAWVTIHTGAGVTVSAVTIDGTATGLTMAASSSLAVRVPSGRTIALTYAGGTPTWDWWLD